MLFIGKEVQERMISLGLSAEKLADEAFMDLGDIQAIINNEVDYESIDEFDMELMCNVLHCKPEYFTDNSVKEKDLLVASMNRGNDDLKSMNVKAKIQDFVNDFLFVNEVLAETN